jgi:glycerol transport system substrate-binding protein
MDYGKKDPSLGWRYTDAWMSMAGMGDVGEPNGLPVDEWGIRVNENSQPVGSCVTRGGATNSPAAVYAVEKAIDWLKNYSPPEAAGMTFSEAGPIPAQGNVAQQMFWYTAFTAAHGRAGPAGDERGWHAEVAHGALAAWRLLEGRPEGRLSGRWFLDADEVDPGRSCQAAWLYAQFVTSKTVDLKKSDVGLTFIRESTINSDHFTERADKLGGLIEFYRSPARVQWSPTGTNVPDYPKLAQLWWQNIGDAMSGAKTAQEALDSLCEAQEKVMERLERAGVQGDIGPKMNEPQDASYWLEQPGAPYPKLENEDETPQTVSYDELIKSWQ